MIAERRRLAFAALRPRPFDAFDRVVGYGVLLAEIFEQRGERGEPMPDRAAAKPAVRQVVAPGDDVRAGHRAEFLRPADAGEPHEVAHRVFVGAARVGGGDVGEPFDFRRHVGEAMELLGRKLLLSTLSGLAANRRCDSSTDARVVLSPTGC